MDNKYNKGLKSIGTALARNTSLKELHMAGNPISNTTAVEFSKVWRERKKDREREKEREREMRIDFLFPNSKIGIKSKFDFISLGFETNRY